jgi:hypothetical protein
MTLQQLPRLRNPDLQCDLAKSQPAKVLQPKMRELRPISKCGWAH